MFYHLCRILVITVTGECSSILIVLVAPQLSPSFSDSNLKLFREMIAAVRRSNLGAVILIPSLFPLACVEASTSQNLLINRKTMM